MSSTRAPRLVAGLLAGALALPLGACSIGSEGLSCGPSSCSVTLGGDRQQVEILGTTLSFDGVQDGRAALRVGQASVSCAEGETVGAGPLTLECSSVTDDSVELSASLS